MNRGPATGTFPFGAETRYRSGVRSVLSSALAVALVACGSPPKEPAKYPPRPEGCEIAVYEGTPPTATENIGSVSATCGDDISDADCERTLKDEACKLGADVVWGVPRQPTMELGKKRLSGRAAHTKAQASP